MKKEKFFLDEILGEGLGRIVWPFDAKNRDEVGIGGIYLFIMTPLFYLIIFSVVFKKWKLLMGTIVSIFICSLYLIVNGYIMNKKEAEREAIRKSDQAESDRELVETGRKLVESGKQATNEEELHAIRAYNISKL